MRQHNFTRAVDRKAGLLMAEYQDKADRVDALLGQEGGGGRVRRQLDQYGELVAIVVGKFLDVGGRPSASGFHG